MPMGLLKDMAASRPRNARLLGLDLGTKTIGLALSDPAQTMATPLKTLTRGKGQADLAALAKIAAEYEVAGFVLGWPINMDGTRGAACDRVQSFADEMVRYPQPMGTKQGAGLWIAFFDERLSTDAVEDFLVKDVDMSRTKRKQVVDALAARLILQGALDYLDRV
jgi:putative holliday junction resolvase